MYESNINIDGINKFTENDVSLIEQEIDELDKEDDIMEKKIANNSMKRKFLHEKVHKIIKHLCSDKFYVEDETEYIHILNRCEFVINIKLIKKEHVLVKNIDLLLNKIKNDPHTKIFDFVSCDNDAYVRIDRIIISNEESVFEDMPFQSIFSGYIIERNNLIKILDDIKTMVI